MTFYIEYAMVLRTNRGIEYIDGKSIRVKNQVNELGAKIGLNDYLKRKYKEAFVRLEIKSYKRDPMEELNELFGMNFKL